MADIAFAVTVAGAGAYEPSVYGELEKSHKAKEIICRLSFAFGWHTVLALLMLQSESGLLTRGSLARS